MLRVSLNKVCVNKLGELAKVSYQIKTELLVVLVDNKPDNS